MKYIADENLGSQVPKYLKEEGIDIISVKELAVGMLDIDVLETANKQERILITLDKDFGELVFKEGLLYFGVILLRLKDESVANKKKVLLKLLRSEENFKGKFTVVRE